MPDHLIELAIEALEYRKAAIDAEIIALRKDLNPTRRRRPVRARKARRPRMSAAARNALGKRMKAYWVKWRAESAEKVGRTRKPAKRAKTKPRPEGKSGEEKKS